MTWLRIARWVAIGMFAGGGLAVLTACEPPAPPRTFTVDVSTDSVDANPGDGLCADAAGHCSLRAAIGENDVLPIQGMTEITLTTDVDLSIPRTTLGNDTGDLDITGRVWLIGNGHTVHAHQIDRVIDQHSGDLAIRDLTIRGGAVTDDADGFPRGGGIAAEGNVVMISSRVVLNRVTADRARGGGVYVGADANVVLSQTIVDQNGVSSFDGNDMTGGGISSYGRLTIGDSSIRDNTASTVFAAGGALQLGDGAQVSIATSSITGNVSDGPAGAMWIDGADVTVTRSTVSANRDNFSTVRMLSGSLTIDRSTFSDNSHKESSSQSLGYELDAVGGPVRIHGSTLVASTVADAGLLFGDALSAPGSIVAGSILSSSVGPVCAVHPNSGGYNLVTDSTCALSDPTDLAPAPPELGPLAANGGPTSTRLPDDGSPVVDVIPPGTPGLCDAAVPTDQRGQARRIGSACDIGSVEVGPRPLSLVVDSAADGTDASIGDRICDDGSGHCTLRAAIDETNAGLADDVITVAAGVDPVLAVAGPNDDANVSGDLDSLGTLTIHGAGATLDARGLDRAIDQLGGDLTIDGLTITGGSASTDTGGAIRSAPGLTLELRQSTLRDNEASDPITGRGGGLAAGPGATVRIDESTISGNSAAVGGGTYVDGGAAVSRSTFAGNAGGALFLTGSPSQVVNSTFTDNTNTGLGSAIVAYGPLDLRFSTLVGGGNQAPLYGGYSGSVSVSATVIDMPIFRACYGNIVSHGYNISSDASCSFTAPTDHEWRLSKVRPLEDNGGPTLTRIPAFGSPLTQAIPNGTPGLCDGTVTTDQRGIIRPQFGLCDIGAVEGAGAALVPATYTVDTGVDRSDVTPGDGVCDDGTGHCTLRAAVDESNASYTDDTIVIAAGVDPTISIPGEDEDLNATGDLDLLGRVTIHGGGATLDAASLDRGIHALAGPVSIDHLTVTHGRAEENGAGIYGNGALTIDHVTLIANVLWGFDTAGAGLRGFGPTTIVDSTISGNSAPSSSGVFLQGHSTIVRSTFTGNTAAGWGPTLFLDGDTTIDASTVSGNTAGAVPGLVIQEGSLVIRNSTIADNVATSPVSNYATAVNSFYESPITIVASTITGTGPSAAILTAPTTAISGSILANQGGAVCTGPASSGGWNLASDASCGLALASDHQSVDALLGALANNGGPTLTRLPGVGSPAIGAIPIGTGGLCDGTLATDQRGVARPQGSACDIGAVEQ